MPSVTLHYDGWLRLPAEICRQLGLATRSTLQLRIEGGAVVLEPGAAAGTPRADQGMPATPAPSTPPEAEVAPAARERTIVGARQADDLLLQEPVPEAVAEPAAQTDQPAPPTRKRAARKPPTALAARPRGRRKTASSDGDEPSR